MTKPKITSEWNGSLTSGQMLRALVSFDSFE
jgi:hypothetical protein